MNDDQGVPPDVAAALAQWLQRAMAFPPYVQDRWVAAQGCDDREWAEARGMFRGPMKAKHP